MNRWWARTAGSVRPGLRGMIANNKEFFVGGGQQKPIGDLIQSISTYSVSGSTCTRPVSATDGVLGSMNVVKGLGGKHCFALGNPMYGSYLCLRAPYMNSPWLKARFRTS